MIIERRVYYVKEINEYLQFNKHQRKKKIIETRAV